MIYSALVRRSQIGKPYLVKRSGFWFCLTRPISAAIGRGDTPADAFNDYQALLALRQEAAK